MHVNTIYVILWLVQACFTIRIQPVQLPACENFKNNRTIRDEVIIAPGVLKQGSKIRIGSKKLLQCDHPAVKSLSLKSSNVETKKNQNSHIFETQKRTGFTENEEFYMDNSVTLDYCIQFVSDNTIEVKACIKPECDSNTLCIPKCCGHDQILMYWKPGCRKLEKDEPTWTPFIEGQQRNVKIRYMPHTLNCNHENVIKIPFTDVEGFFPNRTGSTRSFEEKGRIKLVDSTSKIELRVLTPERKWMPWTQDFCVDGFVNPKGRNKSAKKYTGELENQVMVYCHEDKDPPEQRWVSWSYAWVGVISILCLAVIVVVYSVLFFEQTLHGLSILSYCSSMLFSYLFHTIAHFVALFPHPATGIRSRGGFCLAVALLAQYFLFVNFMWMTIMNFDLWVTFKTIRPVTNSKRLRAFYSYSAVAWGIPALLVAAFFSVDVIYRDPLTLVVVPDYATTSCTVASWSRGEYVYTPLAVILGLNGILVALTLILLLGARRSSAKVFTEQSAERYSLKVFLKLFCVMGVVWFEELLSWFFDSPVRPWYIVVVDCIVLLQPVVLFFMFCVNGRTLGQIIHKFPATARFLGPVKNSVSRRQPHHKDSSLSMTVQTSATPATSRRN